MKSISYLKSKKKTINSLFPFFLCIYTFFMILPWCTNLLPIFKSAVFSSVYKGLFLIFFVAYFLLVYFSNDIRIENKYKILVLFFLFFSIVCLLTTDKNFSFTLEKNQFGESITSSVSIGFLTLFTTYGEMFYSLFVSLSFLLVFSSIKHKTSKIQLFFYFDKR